MAVVGGTDLSSVNSFRGVMGNGIREGLLICEPDGCKFDDFFVVKVLFSSFSDAVEQASFTCPFNVANSRSRDWSRSLPTHRHITNSNRIIIIFILHTSLLRIGKISY